MRSIDIILHFKNAKYAESLARGLCYEYAGLNVFFAEKDEDIQNISSKGILITDKLVKPNSRTIFLSSDIDDRFIYCIPKTTSVKVIMNAIRRIAQKEYGIGTYACNKDTKVIGIFSERGGCGVTSMAITIARVLSAKTDEKVLYLNLGFLDDYNMYTGIEDYGSSSKMEYLFMKEEQITVNIENYCKEDMWGVYYFKPETKKNSFFLNTNEEDIIGYIVDEKFFSHIIVDYGKRKEIDNSILDGSFFIKNQRAFYTSPRNEEQYTYSLCIDKDSFFCINENIEISMKGMYANAIDAILEKCGIIC